MNSFKLQRVYPSDNIVILDFISKSYSFQINNDISKIEFFKEKSIIMASCSNNSSVALTNEGQVYVWGKGDFSKFYDPSLIPNLMESITPRLFKLDDNLKFIKITSGLSHHAAIDNLGGLYTWGER